MVPSNWRTIYHSLVLAISLTPHSPTQLAEICYNADFRDLEVYEVDEDLLVILSHHDRGSRHNIEVLQFFAWLLSKGLKLEHRILRITAEGDRVLRVPVAFYVGRVVIWAEI